MCEGLYDIFGVDLKDKLTYRGLVNDIKDYSNLQKWMIYNSYKNIDADIIVKENRQLLGWEKYQYFDCIFSFGTYFGLICRLFQQEKLSAAEVRRMEPNEKYGILDLLGEKAVKQAINKIDPDPSKNWLKRFESAFSEFAYKTNTIGNYMPCPDNEYNKIKGWPMPVYNDRLELMYGDGKYKQWIDENKKSLFITKIFYSENLRKLTCQKNVRRFNSEDILKLVEWMEEVNKLIGDRTEGLLHQITETAVPLQNSAHA